MIMTWQDYIFVSCGMSATIALICFISLVIIHARDKKKQKEIPNELSEYDFWKRFYPWTGEPQDGDKK